MSGDDVPFRLLFESSPEVLLVLLPDSPRFTMVAGTRARFEVTGMSAAETLGRGIFEIFPDNPDDPAATSAANLRASLERVLATRKPDTMAVQKYDVRGPDGTFHVRYWSPKNLPVLSESGEVQLILHRVEDVTDLVRATEAGERLNRDLALTNRDLDAFASSVSHDLRAPVRAIQGFAGLLATEYAGHLPADARELLDHLQTTGRRMDQLIDDLLAFSRLGRQPLAPEAVSIDRLVREVLAGLEPERRDREVDIRIGALPDVVADASLLRQMFVNLLSNALKFTRGRAPAVIEITCTRLPAEDVFEIRDNGAGFEMQYAGRLFAPFQRLHSQEEFAGTGLGLSLVQRIVERHGGRIRAEGAPGAGATFYVALPR